MEKSIKTFLVQFYFIFEYYSFKVVGLFALSKNEIYEKNKIT